MNEGTAKALIDEYLKWGKCFNRITELSFELDEVTQKAVRLTIAEAESKLYDGLVRPVVKDYPHLEPRFDETDDAPPAA